VIETAGGAGGADFAAATVVFCRCWKMRKPAAATTRNRTSVSLGPGLRRRFWTTGAGGSTVSGAAMSSTTGSSIARMLLKTKVRFF